MMVRMKHLPLDWVNTSNMHHNGASSPVCTFYICSTGKIWLQMILFHFLLVSNLILAQFHTCVDIDWIPLRSEGMFILCIKCWLFSVLYCESSTLSFFLLVYCLICLCEASNNSLLISYWYHDKLNISFGTSTRPYQDHFDFPSCGWVMTVLSYLYWIFFVPILFPRVYLSIQWLYRNN